MTESNLTYLITGASRGMGRGLSAAFLTRPNVTLVAAVRDPCNPQSKSLSNLPTGPGPRLIIDPAAAIYILQHEHGINYLNIVIANAGMSDDFSRVDNVPIDVFRDHVEAVYPLLLRSARPTFVSIGSPLGSIGGMEQRPYPCTAYGLSKTTLHWIVRKVHFENEGFITFFADPGAGGIVKLIDGATRESMGAQSRVWDGTVFPW
ncbi:hypothetical protein BO83DRAFT_397876 [Aspergillus eucalypticola CBS 122712]|uniref:NAD(P)-binding protein n=1 Tax=Aspergillus eucalypticola (strain CBS 122712 / IBT 29274) TaxID=1448314 RepID=A0A317VN17_ASPEC|nr:uncharacterized protein BO83DRAFT_397876 [Aspergillus eucalypticola CBS 122712]PWY75716.1 hypothetical protein BO83DRAFT_397876 [Aspergillus eucalypticola CBS 122712]